MKHTFVLRTEYQAVFDRLSDQQAGALIKSIYAHVTQGAALALSDKETEMAFTFIRQDLDFDSQKYEEICAKRAAAGRKGGKAQKSKCLSSKKSTLKKFAQHNDSVSDSECDSVSECESKSESENNIFTVPPALAQDTPDFSAKNSKPLPDEKAPNDKHLQRALLSQGTTPLHAFAREVLAQFEPSIDAAQQDIWFKRNCRCLKDILDFCHGDKTLALTTIDVCLDGLENTGFNCGYEAILRNITNYYTEAEKRLREASYAH